MPDYSKSVIYTIRSKHNIYVGSTTDFKTRKYKHKNNITNVNRKEYNYKLYKTIRQNDGEWDMKAYSIFPCNSKMELSIEEERVRQLLKADMNMKSCGTGLVGLTKSEYKKQYREKNRDYHIEKSNQYREQNRDELNKKKKQYREQNRDELNEKQRQKVTCECGCDVNKVNLSTHRKTKKHLLLMEKLNQ